MKPVMPERVLERMRRLLGEEGAHASGQRVAAFPASPGEVGAVLRIAREEGWTVDPRGGGTADGEGDTPGAGAADLIVSSSRLGELVEHEPADLTFRAQAGLTVAALERRLAEEGQWLALDPPGGGRVTLGGMVASGVAGPLQAQFGRPRDQLLGVTLVDGSGRILVLGGRVVKNVAGFDLVRLVAGSRGGLGVITEVVFRLYPLPGDDRTLVWGFDDPLEAWEQGRALASLPLPLAAVEWLDGDWPEPLDGSGPRVLVRLLGSEEAVAGMRRVLEGVAGPPDRAWAGPESRKVAAAIAAGAAEGTAILRLHALPGEGAALLALVDQLAADRAALHLLGGTLRVSTRPAPADSTLQSMRAEAGRSGATLTVVRRGAREGGTGTEGPKSDFTGFSPPVAELHRRLTHEFDPGGILPGSWREAWSGEGGWVAAGKAGTRG